MATTGDLAHNPGMCPDWELNHRPFGSQPTFNLLSNTSQDSEFFCKTSNHTGDSAPLQPRFGTLNLLAFPKIKITFEREEISDHWWDLGKYVGAGDGNWENGGRSHGAYFEGDSGILVLCTMFLVSCIFFNKCLYFSYYLAGYLLGRVIYLNVHLSFTWSDVTSCLLSLLRPQRKACLPYIILSSEYSW